MPDIPRLLKAYARGPAELREAVRSVPATGWDATPIAGKWSIRQVVCHLADSEIVYADRMKRVLAEDSPTLFDADPDVFVPALHCGERPPETELNLIEAVRAHMLPILKSCTARRFRAHRHPLHRRPADARVTSRARHRPSPSPRCLHRREVASVRVMKSRDGCSLLWNSPFAVWLLVEASCQIDGRLNLDQRRRFAD